MNSFLSSLDQFLMMILAVISGHGLTGDSELVPARSDDVVPVAAQHPRQLALRRGLPPPAPGIQNDDGLRGQNLPDGLQLVAAKVNLDGGFDVLLTCQSPHCLLDEIHRHLRPFER
jgi:hypothetical protein